MNDTSKVKCKRCLLSEIDKEAFNNIFDYINSLPQEEKVDDIIYKQRLDICKNCEALINGMCKYCGCFVEIRAIKKINYCPHKDTKWSV